MVLAMHPGLFRLLAMHAKFFPVSVPASHFKKNDQVTMLFFVPKWNENGVQTAKFITKGEVWAQDYKV